MTLCHDGAVARSGEQAGPTGDDAGGRPDTDAAEVVRLGLPTDGPCAPLARAAAVAMGRRAGLRRTALGALALAVDEALVLVLPTTGDGIDLEASVAAGTLRITVTPRHPHTLPDPGAVARFDDVVAGLVTAADAGGPTGVVRLEVAEPPRLR